MVWGHGFVHGSCFAETKHQMIFQQKGVPVKLLSHYPPSAAYFGFKLLPPPPRPLPSGQAGACAEHERALAGCLSGRLPQRKAGRQQGLWECAGSPSPGPNPKNEPCTGYKPRTITNHRLSSPCRSLMLFLNCITCILCRSRSWECPSGPSKCKVMNLAFPLTENELFWLWNRDAA